MVSSCSTASGGDSGFGVSYPAACAGVTAVGGTTLYPDASDRGWAENAWSYDPLRVGHRVGLLGLHSQARLAARPAVRQACTQRRGAKPARLGFAAAVFLEPGAGVRFALGSGRNWLAR